MVVVVLVQRKAVDLRLWSLRGSGRTRASQGFFTVERTCSACGGAGQVITDPCSSCNGEGRRRKNRKIEVNIPAGVEDGSRIRLSGEGAVGPNGSSPGDLYLFVSMLDHPIFDRDGIQIYCNVPISVVEASLGGEVDVPTVSGGKVKVKIPAGSQNGIQFKLNGKECQLLGLHHLGIWSLLSMLRSLKIYQITKKGY